MHVFAKGIHYPSDVEGELHMFPSEEEHVALRRDPYLGHLINEHSVIFELDRTLKSASPEHRPLSRHAKGGLAGAVILRQELPSQDNPYDIDVALPIKDTHDNRAYLAIKINSDDMNSLPSYGEEQPRRELIAREAAAMAIHGYLTDSVVTKPLHVSETRVSALTALLHRKR